MILPFDPGDFSWGHGSAGAATQYPALLIPFDPGDFGWGGPAANDFPLEVNGVTIEVHVDSPDAAFEPMAPIARRGAQGKLLSAITSVRGQKRDQRFTTIPLSSPDADTQEAALLIGIPVTCTGWLVGGSITALPYDVQRDPIAGGALFVIQFGLLES